ncbi:MAG: alginate lyase family protein [Anaerolineae bacterium]
MPEAPTTGPRLTDERFFGELVDTSRPGLEEIPAAVARGDFATARRLFAAEARRSLQPERFFRMRRSFEGRSYMYPGESIAEAAERILRLELVSCGTPHRFEGEVDWTANPTFNQYREWTWQLSRHHEWAILAQRYRETGDERYAEGFVRLFRSWVRQAIVPEDAPGNATWCWRTIEAGIRMAGPWPWALHSFYRSPHFTDDDLVEWYKSVWEHGWRLRHFHRPGGNWLIMEMAGLTYIGVLYPQFKDAPAWKAYALERLVEELGRQIYPDGFQIELSTGYHQVVTRNYQWVWDLLEAYDEPIPEAFRGGLEKAHSVNVLLMMPDGRLPDLNDGFWLDVAPLMERAVELYPDRLDFRWAFTRGAEGRPPEQTSTAFPYAGYFVMRTGWEPTAVWALFDGGPFGYGHQHEDKLNLLLHAYGRRLLTEGGNYAYDDSEMRRYVLSTRAHNTIRVDGQDQNRRLHFRREAINVTAPASAIWHTTSTFDLAEASYDEGYGPDARPVARHHRRVIFLKGEHAYLIVIDRLYPADDQAHSYQAIWHLLAEPVDLSEAAAITRDDQGPNLAIIPSTATRPALRLVKGQEAPEWQGWHSVGNHQQGEYEPIPTVLCEWTAQGPSRQVTVLYPLRPDESCPIERVEATAEVEDTSIRVRWSDGSVAELDEARFISAS